MKIRKRISICLFFLLFLILGLSGCMKGEQKPQDVLSNHASPKQEESVERKPETKLIKNDQESKILEKGKRREVGLRLLNEFSDYISKIEQGEASKYNLIMASDRARGLANFNMDDETVKWLIRKQDDIKQNLKDSIVYSGYSVSGVHFIALTHPVTKKQQVYKEAVNKLRGLENEFDFLSDVVMRTDSRSSETSYFAVDVFAEDLLGENKEITIKGVSIPFKKSRSNNISNPNDKRLNESMSIYGREVSNNLIIPNLKWNIFLFDGDTATDEIIIRYDGEDVQLRRE
ncbi:hypothetical protein [Paenibacillus ehimensis]|uniref:hypothetical protein n=2 Tax=Paenibacillus ehimensis TaxID=79264 RepID=UPI000472FC07|nr:hypothetical protein [Paenibacillus ehimensis]MEC0212790.1 hypothetical protein [Paenibacillus ehimensis]